MSFPKHEHHKLADLCRDQWPIESVDTPAANVQLPVDVTGAVPGPTYVSVLAARVFTAFASVIGADASGSAIAWESLFQLMVPEPNELLLLKFSLPAVLSFVPPW